MAVPQRRDRVKIIKVLTVMLIVLLLSACVGAEEETDMLVEITALNVGKADAILVRADEKLYLIDTGTKKGFDLLKDALNTLGVTRLDGVFLTHTDKDHGGGLEKLAGSDVTIGAVYAPSIYYEKKEEKHQAVKAAKTLGQEVIWLNKGDVIDVGAGAYFTVLAPEIIDPSCENNNSLVMMLTTPEGRALFAGDMEFEEEAMLLESDFDLDADYLKVSHHGREDATSALFIARVSPKAAVISTDSEEEPRSPGPRVMRELEESGALVLVTQDYDIGVSIRLRNGQIEVSEAAK